MFSYYFGYIVWFYWWYLTLVMALSPVWMTLLVLYLPKNTPTTLLRLLVWKKKVDCTVMPTSSWWLLRGIKDPDEGPLVLILERVMVPKRYWQMVKCVITKPLNVYRSDIVSTWENTKGEVYFSFKSNGSLMWQDTADKYSFDLVFYHALTNFESGMLTCIGPQKRV